MTVSISSITKAGPYAWRYEWTGMSPFDVYQVATGDLLLSQTTDTSIIVNHTDDGEPPALEIRDADSTGTPETIKYSPVATLQWRGNSAWSLYRIEYYSGAAWTTIANVPEIGAGYYKYSYGPLDDVTTHQFRITPIDDRDYEGYPLPYDFFIRRNPPEPSITATYDSGTGDITIAAR